MRNTILAASLLSFLICSSAVIGAENGTTSSTNAEPRLSAKLVDASQAEALISDRKVIVIDVRTEREFAGGHISGATNLDFRGNDFQRKLETLDKHQPYLVNCAVGGRSAKACKLMTELGFKSVYDLKGGLQAWEKAGKAITK